MDEEEETIILKNSPLFSYLTASAESDDNAVKEEKHSLIQRLKESEPTSKSSFRCRLRKFFGGILCAFGRAFQYFYSSANTNCVHRYAVWNRVKGAWSQNDHWCMRMIDRVVSSKLLDDDDIAVLRGEFESSRKFSLATDGEFTAATSIFRWDWKSLYLYILIAGSTMAYFPYRIFVDDGKSFALFDAIFAIAITATGIRAYGDIVWWNRLRSLCHLIDRSLAFDDMLKKSLKVVRDYEVLARGYTVVTKYTVISNRPFKENNDYVAPCAQLRTCILLAVESLFSQFRHETVGISARTETTSNGHPTFLLATMNDLPAIFENGSETKDGKISLNVLQTCCYCLALQRSEFLRVYVLSNPSRAVLLELIHWIDMWTERISQSLACYEYRSVVQSNTASRKTMENDSQVSSPIYDYAHSLSLHLQSALQRSSQLEKHGTDAAGDISDAVDQLRCTLQKCQTCLDEVDRVLNASSRAKDDGAKDEHGADRNLLRDGQMVENCSNVVYDGSEIKIVDQVFEAYTNGEDELASGSVLDKQTSAQNSQFVSGRQHVLDELKNVLHVRSSIMRQRELKALATRRGITVDKLLEEEKQQELINEQRNKKGENEKDTNGQEETNQFQFRKVDGVHNSFASELMRAIETSDRNGRADEVVLGDEDSSDEEET